MRYLIRWLTKERGGIVKSVWKFIRMIFAAVLLYVVGWILYARTTGNALIDDYLRQIAASIGSIGIVVMYVVYIFDRIVGKGDETPKTQPALTENQYARLERKIVEHLSRKVAIEQQEVELSVEEPHYSSLHNN